MAERFRSLSGLSRALHYGLLLGALAAWAAAIWPTPAPRDWLDHRVVGTVTAVVLALGWLQAGREHAFRLWRDSSRRALDDLRAIARGEGTGAAREHLLTVFVCAVLVVATLVVLSGLPSLYRLDGLFQPAAWVLWCRRIHAAAADALLFIGVAEFISFGIAILPGAGAHRPVAGSSGAA